MPDWLLWLLPVPVATLVAIAWTAWTGRTRGPQKPADSVQEYERFRQALATPVEHGAVPAPPRTRRPFADRR